MSSHQGLRRTFVIFNPASGRGRGARQMGRFLGPLEKYFPGFEYAVTKRPGEESLIADQVISEGRFDFIVAVGGDGTWSNVADRIIGSGLGNVTFGFLASGTGNDFARNFRSFGKNTVAAVGALAKGRAVLVDVGRVVTAGAPLYPDATPLPVRGRHFLNLIGFGFDVSVIEDSSGIRFLPTTLLYKTVALKNLCFLPGVDLSLTSDKTEIEGSHLMLTISNGPFFGGALPIAPAADIADGLLDVCAISNASPIQRLGLFYMAGNGNHIKSQFVHTSQGKHFKVSFDRPPKYELDGEVWQAHGPDVAIEVVPQALRMIVPH
jgi:diacylglycerol kinase (ATP)